MINRNLALITIALGIILFVSGAYGLWKIYSLYVSGCGILFMIFGASFLLWAVRPLHFSTPHILVIGITIAAIVFQVYVWAYKSSEQPPIGDLLWALMPYALCITLSVFSKIRSAVIAGAAFAFSFDLWGYYTVFINPQSSTAALVLIYIPLWSTVILIPFATFIAWLIRKMTKDRLVAP